MINQISKIGLLLTILFTTISFNVKAQHYGGSAYVTVKSKSGTYRVINVVSENDLYNPKTSMADAKNALLSRLKQELLMKKKWWVTFIMTLTNLPTNQ